MDHKLVVLVVEDHPRTRNELDRAVESWENVELITCDSFAAAVTWLGLTPHLDLLISDARLPGERTGIDLADVAVKTFPHLAVVIISAYPLSQLVGFNDRFTYLRKPFDTQQLVDHIESSFHGFKLLIRD